MTCRVWQNQNPNSRKNQKNLPVIISERRFQSLQQPAHRVRIIILAFGLAIVAGWGGIFLFSPKVPAWQGKTMYEWCNTIQPWNQQQTLAGRDALRAIGTNALPFVMDDYRSQPTFVDRAQDWLEGHFPALHLRRGYSRHECAMQILYALGPAAKPLLPELVANFHNDSSPDAGAALMAVGSDVVPDVTNLLADPNCPRPGKLLYRFYLSVWTGEINKDKAAAALPYLARRFSSPDAETRAWAARSIAAIQRSPQTSTRILADGLYDPSEFVREITMAGLYDFGPALNLAPHADLVRILAAIDQTNAAWGEFGCMALSNVNSAPDLAVPVLIHNLSNKRKGIRVAAADSLAHFDRYAAPALPELKRLMSDREPEVRTAASNAVRELSR